MKNELKLSQLLPRLATVMQDALLGSMSESGMIPETTDVKRVECRGKIARDDDGKTTAYISTRDMDRDKEILMPKGIDPKHWNMTGVILEGHDYSQAPVGRGDKLASDDYGVKARIAWAPTIRGAEYEALSKFMPLTFSVGFIPTDTIDSGHADWPNTIKQLSVEWPEFRRNRDQIKRIIRKWALLEVSVVPVPANPFAIQQELEKAIEAGTINHEEAQMCCKMFKLEREDENDDPLPPEFKSWDEFYWNTTGCGPDGEPIPNR